MERRQHERYSVKGAVNFSWNDQGGVRQRRKGLLNNISGGGVLVSTSDPPPNGTCIQFSVLFRPIFGGARLFIRAVGRVIRVELASKVEGRTEFAAVIKTFTLHEKMTADRLSGDRSNSRST